MIKSRLDIKINVVSNLNSEVSNLPIAIIGKFNKIQLVYTTPFFYVESIIAFTKSTLNNTLLGK